MFVQNREELPADADLRLSKIGQKDKAGDFSWETKTMFVSVLLACGNRAEAARQAGVPYETTRSWMSAQWYPKLVEEVKRSARSELNTKMGKIVDKALLAVADRIENGELVLNNKTGELLRKPASLRDVTNVATAMMQQQNKLEELNQEQTVQQETMQELLKQLSTEFAKFNKTAIKASAETIEFTEKP